MKTAVGIFALFGVPAVGLYLIESGTAYATGSLLVVAATILWWGTIRNVTQ